MKSTLKVKISYWLWKLAKQFGLVCVSVIVLVCSGCINCIVRHSPKSPCIEGVYQCTRMAAAGSLILACPHMMSDAPSHGLCAENIVTIPLGIVAFCVDVPCEVVLDTVCLPYDIFR